MKERLTKSRCCLWVSFFELLAMSKCQTSPQLREVCDRNCGGKKHCAECLSEHDLLPTHCFLPVSCHCSACSQPTLCPLLLRLLITEKTGKKVIFLSFFSEKITVSWRVNLNATERRRKSTPQLPYRKEDFSPEPIIDLNVFWLGSVKNVMFVVIV